MPVGRLGTNDPGMNPPAASPSNHLIITQAPHGHPRGRRAPSAIRRPETHRPGAGPVPPRPWKKHEPGRFGLPPWEASPLGDPAPGNPSARGWPRTSEPLEKHESDRFGFPPWEASPLGDLAPGNPSARGCPRTSAPLEKHESGRFGFPPWEASPLGDPAPGDPSARGWPRTSEPLEKHESGRLQSLRNKQAASCTDSTNPAFPCCGNRGLSRACPSTAQALPASVRGS